MPPEHGVEPVRTRVFRPRHRLRHAREFQAVFGARVVAKSGPLTVFGVPNDRPEARLGLSVGRRVGGAVARNAAKRRVREAFRVVRAEFERPGGCMDIVVAVGPHRLEAGTAYQRHLASAAARLWRLWDKRAARGAGSSEEGGTP